MTNAQTELAALNMRMALLSGVTATPKATKTQPARVTLTLTEGTFNLIHHLLGEIETGHLTQKEEVPPC